MLCENERYSKVRISQLKAEKDHAQELKWSYVCVAVQRKMSRCEEILTPDDGEHVGVDEVRACYGAEDWIDSTYSSMIQTEGSGYEVLRRLHHRTEPIIRE